MKIDNQTLQDTFKIGYDAFEESRLEAETVWNNYHNRHYTADQLSTLENRGQPAETFNVIKLFARMLLGYYSNVVNTVTVSPTKQNSIYTAALVNDTVAHILKTNRFNAEGDNIKLGAILSGLFSAHRKVIPTDKKDKFGRLVYKTELSYVPDNELVLDPLSRKDDYSDSRFLHRWKWLSEEGMIKLYGKKVIEELDAYFNHLDINEADFEYTYNGQFTGRYKIFNNYLVVHTIIIDDDGQNWSIHWCGDKELFKKKIKKELGSPYIIYKLNNSSKTEYYGIFREIIETQKSINQALIKIQLMINSQKAFVEDGAVEDIDQFTDQFNRVTGVIEVRDLQGIKIENLSQEVLNQYNIIDKAFDRVQRILSINDSFLGMAFASDSGRKVKLQQNATITALRYLTGKIEQFYNLLGWSIINGIKIYYTAEQVLNIADETVGERWIHLNKPLEVYSGKNNPDGSPRMEVLFEEVLDPETGEPMIDSDGNYIFAPIPEEETEIVVSEVDITINSVAYNDEDEKNQLMLETILSGNIGTLLSKVNPAGFFKAAGLSIKSMKTKHSPDIAQILEQTAQMLSGNPQAEEQASLIAQNSKGNNTGSLSGQLKLPQNTNEGVE